MEVKRLEEGMKEQRKELLNEQALECETVVKKKQKQQY